ncbi:MAG: hypothetical protein ACFCUI_12420 [Bernardetiaceae bacterium]
MEEDFIAYLHTKRIDARTFADAEPERWQDFLELFGIVSPKSFLQQKLFLINDLRRRYPFAEPEKTTPPATQTPVSAPSSTRPPRPKINIRQRNHDP